MTNAIVAEGLRRSFGPNTALDGFDLTVREGTVHGLLGPNGSGKTTTVRVLSTLLRPDAGRATVAGLDVLTDAAELRRKIGLSGQYAAVDEDLTARENLKMVARLYHLGATASRQRADELLERFGLTDDADRPVKGYSGGMRRRVDLACAVVSKPQVLFLDEPTTGLDVRSRMAMWDVIAELVRGGSTLLLTTQYLEEADQLADRITVMDQGKVIAEGTPDELKDRVGGERLEITVGSASDAAAASSLLQDLAQGGEVSVDEENNRVIVPVSDGPEALVNSVRLLDRSPVRLVGTTVRRPSMDEVFLALTDRSPAEQQTAGRAKEEVQ
ncbi:ATP-binding cassette domain-containing protein [Streptomyces sp. DG1A-41]|uniref:ATP-binding cassette domain-containing protein n=1 Tax=Streptomyces sp. DG1A-41 TaxID=3125779 RepID=UPI0030D171EB